MLVALAAQVLAVAVITGRPARQALDLGGLEEVGNAIGDAGKELYLFGQYGNERWSSTNRRVISRGPRRTGHLPASSRGFCAARVPRRPTSRRRAWRSRCTPVATPTPSAAFEALLPLITDRRPATTWCRARKAASIEVRSSGMHKGLVVERWPPSSTPAGSSSSATTSATSRPSRRCRARQGGSRTLLVCSASSEQRAPGPLSDVVVHGPEGVLDLLRQLTRGRAPPSAPEPPVSIRSSGDVPALFANVLAHNAVTSLDENTSPTFAQGEQQNGGEGTGS